MSRNRPIADGKHEIKVNNRNMDGGRLNWKNRWATVKKPEEKGFMDDKVEDNPLAEQEEEESDD